jgi:hypothetical protein
LDVELPKSETCTNYDPVKEAAAQNAAAGLTSGHTNSTGGGPSQPQTGGNSSVDDTNSVNTDTYRLANHLFQCGRGNSLFNCNIENGSRSYYDRI